MTLIIADRGERFVVAGADTRVSVDTPIVSVQANLGKKLIELSDHTVILYCGETGQAQYLIQRYLDTRANRNAGVTELTEDFASFCQQKSLDIAEVPTHPKYFPSFSFVLGGLDKVRGRWRSPRCYALSSDMGFRPMLGGEGYAIDGRPMLAKYMFARDYDRDIDVPTLNKLVAQALYESSKMEPSIGEPFEMVIIRENGITVRSRRDIERDIRRWPSDQT
jgi:20S proteasome alpha/beta subunit